MPTIFKSSNQAGLDQDYPLSIAFNAIAMNEEFGHHFCFDDCHKNLKWFWYLINLITYLYRKYQWKNIYKIQSMGSGDIASSFS